jgi:hypothetical protein
MKTYTIDVWQDDSIWTYEGNHETDEEAQAAALAQLNEDWERDYPDWDELACDMDGTFIIPHSAVMADRIPLAELERLQAVDRANKEATILLPRIVTLLTNIGEVIDTSNPDSELYLDSGADTLQCLLEHEEEVRSLLTLLQPPIASTEGGDT